MVSPVTGKYNICYLNALQTQPDPEGSPAEPLYGTVSWWVEHHNDLVVKHGNGNQVIAPDWDEAILDVSTSVKRQAIFAIEQDWIDGCQAAGFQAIEPDNLDSYARSGGAFTFAADKEFMKLLVPYAHSNGWPWRRRTPTPGTTWPLTVAPSLICPCRASTTRRTTSALAVLNGCSSPHGLT